MAKRELLQLADTYKPERDNLSDCVISEKLDGTRCFWDGGVSRDLPTDTVPWASITDPKTGKRKAKIKPIATGLWSRYGNPIMAPDWFLNQLPSCPLDGELWAGRGKFQLCRSICAGDAPDERFKQIQFACYSSPPMEYLLGTGLIKNSNMWCEIDRDECMPWLHDRLSDFTGDYCYLPMTSTFHDEMKFLSRHLDNSDASVCYMHPQTFLPSTRDAAAAKVEEFLQRVLDLGGEGVVIRDPATHWTPKRHRGLLKYKPFNDAEAVIIGFTSGRETDKGSKHLGRIGALITDYNGKRLELSGLTDGERAFQTDEMSVYAAKFPGADMPEWFKGKHFRVRQTVTFKYRELTDDGIPKEARYWRKREVE